MQLAAYIDDRRAEIATRSAQRHAMQATHDAEGGEWREIHALMLKSFAEDLRHPAPDGADVPAVQLASARPAARTYGLMCARGGLRIGHLVENFQGLRGYAQQWGDTAAAGVLSTEQTGRFGRLLDEALAEAATCFEADLDRDCIQIVRRLGHDLRSQLNVVLLVAEAMSRLSLATPLADYAEKLKRNGERMRMVLDDLRSAESGAAFSHATNELPTGELASACREEVDNLRSETEGLKVEFEAQQAVAGQFDTGLVREALRRLVKVAAMYGAPETAVRVLLEQRDDATSISVDKPDAPPGSDQLAPRPGASVCGPSNDPTLSLLLARQIARNHGGALHTHSRPHGMGFRLELAAKSSAAALHH